MDTKKLLKAYTQTSGLLIPHITKFQADEKNLPETWQFEIENTKEPDPYFHPSSDCLTPARDLYFLKTGQVKPEPIPVSLRRTFDYGKMLHCYYQEIMIAMGVVDRANVERVHQIDVTTSSFGTATAKGTVDLLDVAIPGQGDWLIDIKTMNKNSFVNPPPYLMDKYIAQVNVYADWFNTDKIMILGICKDNPDLREFIIDPNRNLVSDIYDRWTLVSKAIELGIAPD